MRRPRLWAPVLVAGMMGLLGAGGALAAPAPDAGPTAGGTQVVVPAPEGAKFTFSLGSAHGLALRSDGPLYAWGANIYGALGDGTNSLATTPVQVHVPAGVVFTQVAAGDGVSGALTPDGDAYAWGRNNFGQLGDGSTTNSSLPVPVQMPPGVTFTAIDTGWFHSLALGDDGNVYAWGLNSQGQLGDDSTTNRHVPVVVQAPPGVRFTDVEAGRLHSLALGDDGNAYAWGLNNYGQLGDDSTTNRHVPTMMSAPAGVAFTQLATASDNTLALGDDGNVYGWGWNGYGQLGDGTTVNGTSRVRAQAPVGVTFTSVSSGDNHSVAMSADGNAYGWGLNGYGQLGDGGTTTSHVPVLMTRLPAGPTFVQVQAGYLSSLAVTDAGVAYAWGDNAYGLGVGAGIGATLTPLQVLVPQAVVAVTEVSFGGTPGTGLTDQDDGTYAVTTPGHDSCAVDVEVSWTQDGVAQTPVVYPAGFTYLGVPMVADPADQSVQEDESAVFSTAVSGCPAVSALVWEYSADHGVTWLLASGLDGSSVNADGTQLTLARAALGFDGYLFRSVATNGEGTVGSAAASLTVTAGPEPTPSPTPSGATPSPTPSGTTPSPTPSGATPSLTPSGTTPSPGGGLPTTGADTAQLLGVLVVASVLVTAGLVLLVRRRLV